ncbi:hypothetical protein AB0D13_27060 [Streptomyces sp. NPDC048430]|uniref:hypothetical protein n=1 Tax=Streptomyces sp. NPDC048430 TaxID=3155388 RepID=UPI003424057A
MVALLLAACTMAGIPACSSDDSTTTSKKSSTPPASEPSQAKSSADPTEKAKAEVLDIYAKYWRQMERSYGQASTSGTDIKQYAAGVALVQVQQGTADMKSDGQLLTGSVKVGSPTVTQIDIDGKAPSATISSCLDVSHWDIVDAKTKKQLPLPSERLTQYVNVSTLERWPDGWKVIEDDPQEGKPC